MHKTGSNNMSLIIDIRQGIKVEFETETNKLKESPIRVAMKTKKKKVNMKNNDIKMVPGFTLTELLVVLIIIGILVLLALPNLMPLITKAKSTEAQLQLNHVHMLEKSYFYLHSVYCDNLDDISFEQEKLTTDEGKANYLIEIVTATATSFTARATSVVDFDGDGTYNVWEINENKDLKEVTKD